MIKDDGNVIHFLNPKGTCNKVIWFHNGVVLKVTFLIIVSTCPIS